MSLAVALTALALLPASASGTDVAHVSLGSEIESLVAGPDGGAWVGIERPNGHAIGRASAAGAFRTAAVDETLSGNATVGPDGLAWFVAPLGVLLRADAAGAITRFGPFDDFAEAIATGPDGTLWAADADVPRITRVTPQGEATSAPLKLPTCVIEPSFTEMAQAADGAMWIADIGCGKLIRLARDGARAEFDIGIDESPDALAPDAAGGVWFSERSSSIVGHVTAGGTITRTPLPVRRGFATDVAAAADGSAWFAFGRCFLGRLQPGGPLTFTTTPIPARRLAFDPAGGLWLASAARLVHTSPAALGGACDDRGPSVRVPGLRRRTSLAALRRGIRVDVREPSFVSAMAFYDFGPDEPTEVGRDLARAVRGSRGGSATYRVPAGVVRRFERALAAGRRPEIAFYVRVTDREGNPAFVNREARVVG